MKKLVILAATLAMMLAALAPAAIAQEEADASCEPGVDCQDVFTGDDTEGFDFLEGFEVPTQEEILGDDFFVDSDFGNLLGGDFLAGFGFVFGADEDGSEDAPSLGAATAGDGQYDDDGGLTPEQLAEGNMDEPLSDNRPVGP